MIEWQIDILKTNLKCIIYKWKMRAYLTLTFNTCNFPFIHIISKMISLQIINLLIILAACAYDYKLCKSLPIYYYSI